MKVEISPKMVSANEAYQLYHVTRAWLRERRNAGTLQCSETHGVGFDGKHYIKYLYNVSDIERELRSFASRAQAHQIGSSGREDAAGENRW